MWQSIFAVSVVSGFGCVGYRTRPLACVATTYEAQVLADGPIAYYRMNDASVAAGLADSSGYSQTATLAAGVPTLRQAPAFTGSGYSIGFSGAEVFSRLIANAHLTAGNRMTVESWVKWQPVGVAAYVPWSFRDLSDLTLLDFANSTPDYVGLASGHGDIWGLQNSTNAYRDVWLYIVVDFAVDGLQSLSKTYYNGTLFNASLQAGSEYTTSVLDGNFEIGRFYGGTGFWIGQIDEVAIYGAALTAERVSAHYQAATNASYCVNNY